MNGSACFHCALPVDRPEEFQVEIDGKLESVCCPGCKAVAELIRDTGMTSYYAMRDAPQPGVGRPADDAAEWEIYNSREMLAAFAETEGEQAGATIYVGGMYCSACSWLVETTLSRVAGVTGADVNPVTHRAHVRFWPDQVGLGSLLAALAGLGYDPQPLAPESGARPEVLEQRYALKRLLVASLGMMQVMMFAIGLYAGDFQGMEENMQRFLRWVSFAVTTPVVLYSAQPFYKAAWRGIRTRMPGMDLPVSIAISAAYLGSVYATLTRGPSVWYDSVVMFVFFLTLGRFLEMRARHRSIDRSIALSTLLPTTVARVDGDDETTVPISQLVAGDIVLIRPGDPVPADGTLILGETSVDEALLSGESKPKIKQVGDALIAGSVNLDGKVRMRVETTGSDTTLGTISRLSERARYARPAFVQLADRVASYIVIAILVIAAVVATSWYFIDPDRAFVVTLSVLVVTCPCALALATPAAFAAAGTRLAQLRLLVTNGNAIEALASANRILFDKTGTVTSGCPVIDSVYVIDDSFNQDDSRRIAAALETVSSHPIASAFRLDTNNLVAAEQAIAIGEGVTGTIDGQRWRLGKSSYINNDVSTTMLDDGDPAYFATQVYLGTEGREVACFTLNDALRPGTEGTIEDLRKLGLEPSLISGDDAVTVGKVARLLGIHEHIAGCTPADKLERIRTLQATGDRIAMVGDGINDAPVLAGADVSVALANGAALAQTSADIILVGESLLPLADGVRVARQTLRVVRQNLAWAIVYNAAAVPLAVLGYVPPWAAAIGMSASSLIVVLNSLRITRTQAA